MIKLPNKMINGPSCLVRKLGIVVFGPPATCQDEEMSFEECVGGSGEEPGVSSGESFRSSLG